MRTHHKWFLSITLDPNLWYDCRYLHKIATYCPFSMPLWQPWPYSYLILLFLFFSFIHNHLSCWGCVGLCPWLSGQSSFTLLITLLHIMWSLCLFIYFSSFFLSFLSRHPYSDTEFCDQSSRSIYLSRHPYSDTEFRDQSSRLNNYHAEISVVSCSADGVLCRIHMPLAVAQHRPWLHLTEYFPIHRDLDLSPWVEMVLHDRIPQTSHIRYEWFRAVVPRSQSVPCCSASWLWPEFFS
jgi:hypothetical protein